MVDPHAPTMVTGKSIIVFFKDSCSLGDPLPSPAMRGRTELSNHSLLGELWARARLETRVMGSDVERSVVFSKTATSLSLPNVYLSLRYVTALPQSFLQVFVEACSHGHISLTCEQGVDRFCPRNSQKIQYRSY